MFKVGDKVKYVGPEWADYFDKTTVYTVAEVCNVYKTISIDGNHFWDANKFILDPMSKKPHTYAEVIKAWADGAKVEFWDNISLNWYDTPMPSWSTNTKFRVKPDPKPDPKPDYTVKAVQFIRPGVGVDINYAVEIVMDGETDAPKDMKILSKEYYRYTQESKGTHTVHTVQTVPF